MTPPNGRIDSVDEGSRPVEAVSFDLFGTLVSVDQPADPAAAVGDALEARGIDCPADWDELYRTSHVEIDRGRELSLSEHVLAALATAGIETTSAIDGQGTDSGPIDEGLVREALLDAFDAPIRTRDGAVEAVETLAERVPVGILSNCSVPGLVSRTVQRSSLPDTRFDAVLSSVDVGWRKPWNQAFEAVATELGADIEALFHVGDDARTDGGATQAGAQVAIVGEDGPLDLDALAEEIGWLQ